MSDAPNTFGPAEYARCCVEHLVRGEKPDLAPSTGPFVERAACFVSIKAHGELRGCIGSLEPAEDDLGAEIARNALSAAFHDPRFPAVSIGELDDLTYSVDVLGRPEPCDLDDLDPLRYGVIVEAGGRRGVLLPDLAGVDTVGRQVDIARQKAGIRPGDPVRLSRFTVRRWRESAPPRDPGG